MATIAFIGLGNMGGPMAANLMAAGHAVTVFDVVDAIADAAAEQGATKATSAQKAVDGAEFVISMLPSGEIVKNLYIHQEKLLDAIDPATLVIDSSTISRDDALEVHAAAEQRGIAMVDAPVSGGVGGARAGTLAFICGGEATAVARAKPVLENMGKAAFHAGPSGAGQVAKICNNMLLAVHMIGTAEALNMGVTAGLDPAVLSDILQASSGNNWSVNTYNPWPGVMDGVPSSNDYQGGFLVKLMNKDLGLAAHAAERLGADTPMGDLARKLYVEHGDAGYAERDFSSILKRFRGE